MKNLFSSRYITRDTMKWWCFPSYCYSYEETRRQLQQVTARLRQLEEEREQMALGWAQPPPPVNAPAAAACPVCTDHYQALIPGREASIMGCGHSACGGCITRWNEDPRKAQPPPEANAPSAAACGYIPHVPGCEARIMVCGHSACGECLDRWNKQPARLNGPLHCPTCRFRSDVYTVEALPRNFALMQ
ncbi:hypothetical protein CAEBREN_12931 [Caenorhabditis brenneri]|uniref:RING-type domain-containing protein n=1 Tax=Caenorhabditis brenneri TaxID=135651 RepID=G0PF79_CAEBE|nr:hypothetical protein CAEBREN_12931 [Caenorhabditis brenneri]